MTCVSILNVMSHYARLYSTNYINQGGYGLDDIEVYRGPIYRQSGAGLGRFLKNSFQFLRPLLSSGVNAITDQGLKSASSVLSQLGKKNLKTILSEEGEKAVRNLSDRAIQKLKRAQGQIPSDQTGSGIMPIGLTPFALPPTQLKRLVVGRRRKGIKASTRRRKNQSGRGRKLGGFVRSSVRKRQIGAGRKKRRSKKSRKSSPRKRKLDIFH